MKIKPTFKKSIAVGLEFEQAIGKVWSYGKANNILSTYLSVGVYGIDFTAFYATLVMKDYPELDSMVETIQIARDYWLTNGCIDSRDVSLEAF